MIAFKNVDELKQFPFDGDYCAFVDGIGEVMHTRKTGLVAIAGKTSLRYWDYSIEPPTPRLDNEKSSPGGQQRCGR
jgi:hypothetical protein